VQVALGVAAGGGLVALAAVGLAGVGSAVSARQIVLLAGYVAFMMGVCLLACVVPTRRALRVQPTEALREDG
jgi:ABC-type antimicrobial peptide transport system permease subunit